MAFDIAMVEVLVGLSESITSMGDHDASKASVALGSSSLHSVNAQPPEHELVLSRNPSTGGDGDEEEDKQDV